MHGNGLENFEILAFIERNQKDFSSSFVSIFCRLALFFGCLCPIFWQVNIASLELVFGSDDLSAHLRSKEFFRLGKPQIRNSNSESDPWSKQFTINIINKKTFDSSYNFGFNKLLHDGIPVSWSVGSLPVIHL